MTRCLLKTGRDVCSTQRYTYKEAETYEVGRVVPSHSGTTVEHNEEDQESGATEREHSHRLGAMQSFKNFTNKKNG